MAMNTRAQAPRVPDRAAPEGLEAKWGEAWENQGTYAFDRTATREQVYSIDTPPPTVSGSLHIGHVFSYTHTDVVARYQRMIGKSVFYPMGWDDNGLPTERRVQNYFGVRVDATLPYDPDFEPPHVGGDGKSIKARDQKPISRKNFVELCERLTVEDEAQFEALWRYLGLSVDWKQNYQTIGARARKVAQAAFLRNLARGEAYQAEAPCLWDVTFQTAVAQAELESREYPGFYHRLAFHITDAEAAAKAAAAGAPVEDGVDVCIETTRPELLAACVALIAHPDDERYKPLFGTTVASPVYGVEVPILPHPEAEMDKGAGIAMCCTFGDTTDIDWWRDLELPLRAILRKDGRIITETPEWITTDAGRAAFAEITGKTTFSAREAVVAALRESGELKGEPTKTMRQTNFFEKGDKPLEIVTSRQWYIRNGGRAWTNPSSGADLNEELIGRGRELEFHPDFMRVRYENWVKGLKGDWLVSRQRSRCGTAWTRTARSTMTTSSPRLRLLCRLIRRRTCRRATRRISAAWPAASWASWTSWTRGRRPRCPRSWPVAGWMTRTSSLARTRWICARRARTSSARGCSRPWCARTWSSVRSRGSTRACRAGSWIRTTRRCPSLRATS